jgi:hypothetical protein
MAGSDVEDGEQPAAVANPPAREPSYQKHAKLPALLSLEGNQVENWRRFKKRWTNFMHLSGLKEADKLTQVAQLENCLADDALTLLDGFEFGSAEEDRTVNEILEAFEAYAIGETNETLERYKLGRRSQQEGESMDKFLADLRILVKSCQYCKKCEPSILRDRIVLGIRCDDTREELLKARKLDLPNCIDICRAGETASSHGNTIKSDGVNRVEEGEKWNRNTPQNQECRFCPYSHPMRKEKCPAWGKTCAKCGLKNHFALKCKNPSDSSEKHTQHSSDKHPAPARSQYRKQKGKGRGQVYNLEEEPNPDEMEEEWYNSPNNTSTNYDWCNSVTNPANTKKSVKCKMLVGGQEVVFLIDTGASINTLPAKHASKNLEPYDGVLKMWNKAEDKPAGKCREMVTNPKNGHRYSVPFVVFHGDRLPILSYQTSLQMKLITVESSNFDMVATITTENYADVFDGNLGQLPGTQHMKLKPDSRPVVMANRRVPLALRPKIKEELDRLTEMGVIVPVDVPTPWVSQTVVTHKKSGELRICLDPHELNKCILREHFTLPILEDVLHELREARVFSKADLSSGYWHVKLDEESSFLTTFQTCFGRYR